MAEYEVGIEERPLGIRFAHADNGETVVIHFVKQHKAGHKLGLLPGDILIAINGKSVLEMSSQAAMKLFRGQQLPFKASFRRFADFEFDSEEKEQPPFHQKYASNAVQRVLCGLDDSEKECSDNFKQMVASQILQSDKHGVKALETITQEENEWAMKIALSIQKKKERKQLKKTASQGLLIDEQLERVLSGLDDSEKEFMKGLGYDFLAQMAEDGLMSNQRGNEQANAIVEDQKALKLAMEQYKRLSIPGHKEKLLRNIKRHLTKKKKDRELKQQQKKAQHDETVAEYQRAVSGDVMSERSLSPTHSVSSQIYVHQHSHSSFAPPSASEAPNESGQLDEKKETEWGGKSKMLRYQKLDDIGSGAFGTVYKMKDQATGNIVAVKKVDLSKLRHARRKLNVDRRQLMMKILKEKEVMQKCKHPHIVKLLDEYKNGNKELYIVMEFCSGGNLAEFIDDHGRMRERIVQTFAWQIKEALLHLKSVNVMHRDLKPENILLTTKDPEDAILKLTDFGESTFKNKTDDGRTMHKTAAGTGMYMAPEMLKKQNISDHNTYGSEVDLWSFGIIIFEMRTNKLPFQANMGQSLLQVIESTKFSSISEHVDLSIRGERLLKKLLEVNPNLRRKHWNALVNSKWLNVDDDK